MQWQGGSQQHTSGDGRTGVQLDVRRVVQVCRATQYRYTRVSVVQPQGLLFLRPPRQRTLVAVLAVGSLPRGLLAAGAPRHRHLLCFAAVVTLRGGCACCRVCAPAAVLVRGFFVTRAFAGNTNGGGGGVAASAGGALWQGGSAVDGRHSEWAKGVEVSAGASAVFCHAAVYCLVTADEPTRNPPFLSSRPTSRQ